MDLCKKLIKKNISPKDRINLNKKVYNYLLKNIVKKVNFVLTDRIVKKTFELLDKTYFHRAISNFITKTNSSLTFKASNKLKKTAGFCKWNTYLDDYGKVLYGDYQIQISKSIIDNIFKSKKIKSLKINGLHCYDKLECYINLFQHELTHLLMVIFCPDDARAMGGHTIIFRKIVLNLFGQTEYKHLLLDGDSVEQEKKTEDNKRNLNIGDIIETIKLGKDNIKYKGEVIKLTKKYVYVKFKEGNVMYFSYSVINKIKKNKNNKTKNLSTNDLKKELNIGMNVKVNINGKLENGEIVKINKKRAIVKFENCQKFYVPYELIKI